MAKNYDTINLLSLIVFFQLYQVLTSFCQIINRLEIVVPEYRNLLFLETPADLCYMYVILVDRVSTEITFVNYSKLSLIIPRYH